MLTEINNQLFMMINASPNASYLMIQFAIFCATYLIYLPILITTLVWLRQPLCREIITKILLVIFITISITILLRLFIIHPRPFSIPLGTNFLPYQESNSFPSKHTAFIFAMVFTLLFSINFTQVKQKILFIMSMVVAILIGWSRIYLGVHWPLDIFAAILISFIGAFLTNYYWLKYQKHIMKIVLSFYRFFFYPFIRLGISKY